MYHVWAKGCYLVLGPKMGRFFLFYRYRYPYRTTTEMMRQWARHFYTAKPSTFTRKVVLEDGSCLFLNQPQPQQSILKLPPRVHTYPTRSILTQEQIKEIQLLRKLDPDVNTVLQLSKKYNVFPGFIMSITKCPLERRQRLDMEMVEKFNALDVSKKKKSIDRLRRKDTW
jgi:hypothetical protein